MRSNSWIDITIPLREGMITWHADPKVHIRRVSDVAKGDEATVSALTLASHTGTHIDAPVHLLPGGETLDDLPLDACLGPARIIHIKDDDAVTAAELAQHRIRRGERILLQTRNSNTPWYESRFRTDYVALTPDAAMYLMQRGIRLLGIDALSVDPYGDNTIPSHRVLLEAGIWIVEGLNVCDVSPGRYNLACLPLRIAGADGSPVRAVIRPR